MEAKQVIVFAIVLLLLDLVWLIGAKKHHEKTVMDIQRSPLVVDKSAAIAFYILAGLVYASIITKLQKTGMSPFKSGAMLGAAMYFTFDFTNKAIFKDYRWSYAIADGLWGTFAVGLAAHITSKLVKSN
jgi:uncharacterized membrane protein